MKKLTAQWVRKAEVDFDIARKLARGTAPYHDAICFHAQQSAEKYLKALLVEPSNTSLRFVGRENKWHHDREPFRGRVFWQCRNQLPPYAPIALSAFS